MLNILDDRQAQFKAPFLHNMLENCNVLFTSLYPKHFKLWKVPDTCIIYQYTRNAN